MQINSDTKAISCSESQRSPKNPLLVHSRLFCRPALGPRGASWNTEILPVCSNKHMCKSEWGTQHSSVFVTHFIVYTSPQNTQTRSFCVRWVSLQLFWPEMHNFCRAAPHRDHYGNCATPKDVCIYKGLFNNLWNEADESLQWKSLHMSEIWKIIPAYDLTGKDILEWKKSHINMVKAISKHI